MKDRAKVVIIGGGVVGVSSLYHLARKGWGEDCILLEKAELTSGSTWHAAGLLPLFNMSYSVGQIHKYSVELYSQLEQETGQHVGFRQVGNLRLAMNDERMDEYHQYAATARTIGVDVDDRERPHRPVGASEAQWTLGRGGVPEDCHGTLRPGGLRGLV